MQRIIFLLILLPLLATACVSAQAPTQGPQTQPPAVTASPVLAFTQTSAVTPAPATNSPTATPDLIDGTLTIKVNVRSGPGTDFASLGLLNAGEKIQVVLQDASGKWYQILYPSASGGRGWLAAQFVQVAPGQQVPVEASPTPAGPNGRILQRLNVRSGPGTTFNSLGTLEPDGVVSLTGKNATAAWFQILYPSGPGGRGWVTAQFIQTDATDLQVLDDFGTPVAAVPSGPTAIPVTPTPTVGPAFADGDSQTDPAIHVTFSASGTHLFTYSSQVSTPNGDPADWIAFTPFATGSATARLVVSLACSGNSALTVEIHRGGALLSGWGSLACGDQNKIIALSADQTYLLRLAPAAGNGLRLVGYTLTVQNLP